MKLHVFALVVLLVVSRCAGHIGGNVPPAAQDVRPQTQYYCGRVLARTLAKFCPQDSSQEKRGDSGTMYGALLAPYADQDMFSYDWPWITRHKTRNMEVSSRGKRQIVDECCNKPCSIDVLLSYC